MAAPHNRIEDEILRVLLLLIADRRSKGKDKIGERAIRVDLKKAARLVTETEAETESSGEAEKSMVPVDLLQLILKPDLPAAVLEMIAKLLNSDPQAHRALVKLLTATSTPANVRTALTAVLAKCTEHGYSNAENVLREALTKTKELTVLKQLTVTIQSTSRYTADYLKLNPSHTPTPKPRPWGQV